MNTKTQSKPSETAQAKENFDNESAFWQDDLTVVANSEMPNGQGVPENNGSGPIGEAINGTMQTSTTYTTAKKVIEPRNSNKIAARLKDEATRSGESFFYGWGSGKNKISGPSIKLAQAAARCYGNTAIEMGPIQDMKDAWIFTAYFVDLETGFTYGRQFRQSKHWTIHGKHDPERKDDMRFQIGQSKAIRNVIINCVPEWIITGAMKAAMNGVRDKVLHYIDQKGLAAAQQLVVSSLAKHGVKEEDIIRKCEVAKLEAIDAEMIVLLRGDMYALDNGMDHAHELFPSMVGQPGNSDSTEPEESDVFGDEANQGEAPDDTNQEVKQQSSAPPKANPQTKAKAGDKK